VIVADGHYRGQRELVHGVQATWQLKREHVEEQHGLYSANAMNKPREQVAIAMDG
jgi:hypothetical protein